MSHVNYKDKVQFKGVSNKVTQTKLVYDHHIQCSSKNTKDLDFHGMKVPPPPCFYERPPRLRSSSSRRRGFIIKKQDDDPFYIAYKECTKTSTSKKGKSFGGLSKDDFFIGMKMKNKDYISSVFSCKHSCSVREDSVVTINLSHIPMSKSIREKRGIQSPQTMT
ncbi:hypothetical protein RDI58_028388 [Solanum bulbocastanum]|uniref:Uncharacterized protein n=1 Tax=Solanum bulbocastanum TaxID=147425 RepID=A0AAN8SQ65_SOLBU